MSDKSAASAGTLHVMESTAKDLSENIAGLAATGVNVVLATSHFPVQGHPLVPVIHLNTKSNPGNISSSTPRIPRGDFDLSTALENDIETEGE
jgi:hypothetical protein